MAVAIESARPERGSVSRSNVRSSTRSNSFQRLAAGEAAASHRLALRRLATVSGPCCNLRQNAGWAAKLLRVTGPALRIRWSPLSTALHDVLKFSVRPAD